MEKPDYKILFEHLFDEAMQCVSPKVLEFFLKNEEIPFEYCQRAWNAKRNRMTTGELAALGCRLDCPDDIAHEAFRIGQEQDKFFFVTFCYNWKKPTPVPEWVFLKFQYFNANCHEGLLFSTKLPERIQRKLLGELVMLGSDGEIDDRRQFSTLISANTFILYQQIFPNDCLETLKKFKKYLLQFDRKTYMSAVEKQELLKSIDCLMEPLTDSQIDDLFKWCSENEIYHFPELCYKCACNRSISDYGMMQLVVRAKSTDMLDKINKLLEGNKERREAYRKGHGR